MTTSLSFVICFHVALSDVASGTPPPFVMSMWLALIHLVTWRCLAGVVMGVGDGCGWRREETMFGPLWAVTKGGGGDVHGWW
jgi:hypothetical protein